MAYPELYSDERIVLQAQNIKVKSVSFEGVLTTRRLVLIDSKKNTIPPQEINLATLKDVEAGENAIRDPTITLSIITISGNTRQMILTFSKTQGGERRRECDEWVRTLKPHLKSSIQHPVSQEIPVFEEEPRVPSKPSSTTPRKVEVTNTLPQKKKIEVARPMKKIVDATPAIPVPVETSSLPSGSFCSRCGSRIPPESAFCNRCGTRVLKEADFENPPVVMPAAPTAPTAPDTVPMVSVHVMPAPEHASEKRERPIEQVIHSIEPLIEDSVPRTEPSPLVPSRQASIPSYSHPEPVEAPAPAAESPLPEVTPEVKWPVLSTTDSPVSPEPPGAGSTPPSPPPGSPPATPSPPAPKKSSLIAVAVLAIIVVIVIAGAFTFMNSLPGSQDGTNTTPATTVTPAPVSLVTTVPTPIPTTAAVVTVQPTKPPFSPPPQGVWVRVSYPGNYTGAVGTPNRMSDVANTGDQLYQIPTSEGPVVASIQKVDGSDMLLMVEVYKDGNLVKQTTTIAPKGIIEIQMLLKPPATTVVPTSTSGPAATVKP